MKRIRLLRYLHGQGCVLLREGGRYKVYHNRVGGRMSVNPRHAEIKAGLDREMSRERNESPPTER